MLARDGTLYYDLNNYPYTVCAYTPIFYFLEAGLFKLGIPIFIAGRLVSFAALIGILNLLWRLIFLYTKNISCAWTGLLLCAATTLIPFWGTVGQVDTLAVFLSIAAFHQYSIYAIEGKNRLLWAAAFGLGAFFTKQTMLACPAAIFILLWFNHKKTAKLGVV